LLFFSAKLVCCHCLAFFGIRRSRQNKSLDHPSIRSGLPLTVICVLLQFALSTALHQLEIVPGTLSRVVQEFTVASGGNQFQPE
jgi:hypothetical protein